MIHSSLLRPVLACLALLLALAACAAPVGPGTGRLPGGQAWPADPQAGRLYYDPAPLADPGAALEALVFMAPKLSGPDGGALTVHVTKGLAVFRLDRTGYEYQSVDRSPWYPTGYPYCGRFDLMDDCPWPQTMRVKVTRTERMVLDPAELRSLELFTDNRLRLVHGQGILELVAQDRGTLLDLADALAGLAKPHGFAQAPGPGPLFRDLTPREAAALGVNSGVLAVSVPEGCPLARTGVQRLDVVLAVDQEPADAVRLNEALSSGGNPRLTVLAWEPLDAAPWIRTRTFDTDPVARP